MKIKAFLLPAWLLFFLLLGSAGTRAQSPQADFQKVFDRYQNTHHLSLMMEVYAYSEEEGRQSEADFSGVLKKSGSDFYSKVWGREMIVRGERMLLIDLEAQQMTLGRAQPRALPKPNPMTASLDSFMVAGGAVKLQGQQNGLRHYRVQMPESTVASIDLYLDQRDFIVRMTYHYREWEGVKPVKDHLDIHYRQISFAPPPERYFDLDHYLEAQADGSYRALGPNAHYSVETVAYQSLPFIEF